MIYKETMATKLDNDLAKHTANFGYNAVDSLYINSNGFSSSIDGTLTANRTLTIPDNSGTLALTSDLLALGGLYLPLTGGTLSGRLIFSAAGNVNNPAIEFVDSKLGIYRHGSNHLRIGVNGTAVQGWQETYIENLQQVRNIDGAESTPAISFANNLDMGLWRVSGSELGISTGGVKRLSVTNTGVSANIIPIIADNYKSNNLGTAGNTLYGATNNTQGMYFGINRINFSTNSVERLNIQDTFIQPSVPLRLADGGFVFTNSTNTGITYTGGNRILVSNGGTQTFSFANGGLNQSLLPTQVPVGSASAVGLFGSGFSSTGLYWTAGPILNVSVNGTQRAAFESGGVKLYGSTAGNNALYVPTGLQYYEELGPITMTFTFGTNTQTGNIYLTRVGRLVNFHLINDVSRAPSTTITQISTDTAIPLRFRPVSNRIIGVVMIGDGAGNAFWFVSIETTGNMSFVKLTAGTSGTHSVYAFSTSWSIV